MFLESNFRKVKTDDYTRDRMTDSKSRGYTKKKRQDLKKMKWKFLINSWMTEANEI